MRVSLLSLLLLSAATPALAADPTPDEPTPQIERSEPRAERPSRAERADRGEPEIRAPRPERIERTERPEPEFRSPQPERIGRAERFERREAPRELVRDIAAAGVAPSGAEDRPRPPSRADRQRPFPSADGSGWRERGGEGRGGRDRVAPPAPPSPVFGSDIPTPDRVTRDNRDGRARDLRDRIAAEGVRRDRVENPQWRRDWRQDRRYDWRRHRDRDRTRFHIGIYIDPFGYDRRNWELGWRLPSRYFASRYWINDPSYYRLPPVGGPYRWIRYHDDVLLVDLRNGRVLDVIRDFFW